MLEIEKTAFEVPRGASSDFVRVPDAVTVTLVEVETVVRNRLFAPRTYGHNLWSYFDLTLLQCMA